MNPAGRGPLRTSVTNPLRIDELAVPGASGRIGMTLCPGRRGFSTDGRPWRRDLETDLDAIRAWGADLAITLIEPHEVEVLEIPSFEATVCASGIPWRFVPIVDGAPPDERFAAAWPEVGAQARAILRDGGAVLLHCRAGLGRTGTVAAQLLVEFGTAPADAIRAVRDARPGTIETEAQARYVRSLAPPGR